MEYITKFLYKANRKDAPFVQLVNELIHMAIRLKYGKYSKALKEEFNITYGEILKRGERKTDKLARRVIRSHVNRKHKDILNPLNQ